VNVTRRCHQVVAASESGYRVPVERDEIEAEIRSAFAGVTLGSGVSLRQAQAIDNRILGLGTPGDLDRPEVTDDWMRVSHAELRRDCVAHLDGAGLRYYMPALLLWLLDHYGVPDVGVEMTVIGTVFALAWGDQFDTTYREVYASFTEEQRAAIARYVEALPRLVELNSEDLTRISRALDRYWMQFLPGR
jgi:Family of unknown function (DUF6714)